MNPYESPASPATAQGAEGPRPQRWRILLVSLALMLPWPILAIGLCLLGDLFDHLWESMFMFGSITMLFLMPILCAGFEIPEVVFGLIIGIVWCAVLLFPTFAPARWRQSSTAMIVMYVLQGLFSSAQAALGVLMILGKGV